MTVSQFPASFMLDALFAPFPSSLKQEAENGTTHLKLLKTQAKLLHEHLKAAYGVHFTHAQALDTVSRTYGFTDYNHAKAHLGSLSRAHEVQIGNVLRKRFPTDAAYVKFALSAPAPRFSIGFPEGTAPELAVTFGVKEPEILFCNDKRELQRFLLGWEENKYEIAVMKAEDDPMYSKEEAADWGDSWELRAGPAVPTWYTKEFFGDMTDELRQDPALLQNLVLDRIFDESEFFIWDSHDESHRETLADESLSPDREENKPRSALQE